MNSYVTVTDQFCGAGGSSIGATAAGAELKLALNHWPLAIETHNSNFPDALHDCTDISACDPRRYPSTDILITSPECTNHSLAKGKARRLSHPDLFGAVKADPAAERSRATMWDVPRFAEFHRYQLIVVENVVEARSWVLWEAWLHAMQLLGYDWEIVYFNSMFAHPTPQSRDRMYVVFWRRGAPRPDLAIQPAAFCARCQGNVQAVQSWKNPRKRWGKYRQQYVYRCPTCQAQVEPYYYCAANAIDWSLPAPRIGDRERPLKERTLARIRVGLEKFGRRPLLMDRIHNPTRDRHALVVPPFLVSYYTRVSGIQAAVAGVDEPVPTVPGWAVHYLAQPGETPSVEECGFRMLQPHEIHRAMAFPPDYKVLGNQRDRVKQYGNAVTPPVMSILMERCVATLAQTAAPGGVA